MKPIGVQMGNAKPVFGAGLGPGAFMRPAGNPGASGIPPIPALDNVELRWAFFNWNPVGNVEGNCVVGAIDGDSTFLGTEPYENNWALLISGDQDLAAWRDNSLAGVTGEPRGTAPTIDVANKQLVFSAVGGVRSDTSLANSTTKTFYILFKFDDLLGSGETLFVVGDITTTDGAINCYHAGAGDIRVNVKVGISEAGVQTTIADSDWHLICVTYDSANATVADQLNIYLDNVEGTANNVDLASTSAGLNPIYVGGDHVETWTFNGAVRMVQVSNQVDSPATRAAMYARVQYLQGLV